MLRCLLELYSAVLFVTETKRMTTKMTRYPEASLSELSTHFKGVYILTCASWSVRRRKRTTRRGRRTTQRFHRGLGRSSPTWSRRRRSLLSQREAPSSSSAAQTRKKKFTWLTCTRIDVWVSHLSVCAVFPPGFACSATDSSIITSSPTSSWCSSCSAPCHSLPRTPSETSQLAIL